MIINSFLTVAVCYLIGCVPFSLIFTRFFASKNPGIEGSGNYGAMNSYEITNKKYIGILVFLFDCLKGALAVFITYNFIFPKSFYLVLATVSVVLGHTFNIFLKFKGGRGLATTFGAIIIFNPFLGIIWGIIWLLFYFIIKKEIIFANIWATLLTPLITFFAPSYIIYFLNYNYLINIFEYRILTVIVCMIIFAGHFRSKKI